MKNKIIIAIIAVVVLFGGIIGYTVYSQNVEAAKVAEVKANLEKAQAVKQAEDARVAQEADDKKKADEEAGIFRSTSGEFSWRLVATGTKSVLSYINSSNAEKEITKLSGQCVVENMSGVTKEVVEVLLTPIVKCEEKGIFTYIYKKSKDIKMATTKEKCDDFTTCQKFSSVRLIGKFE